mmetsp:Transcript_8166/g.20081  ORF Transcript_8166/g.20081 Transcript_8166/m.20081 type:complete len:224 (-) Transcript_8166:415-1086(-)
MFFLGHQTDECSGILECMFGTGSPRVFPIIGKFVRKPQVGNGISVDHRGTTTSNHRPDLSGWIQDGQLERGSRLAVEISNVGFFWKFLSSKGRGQIQGFGSPVRGIQKGGCLVNLGGQIQWNNRFSVLAKDDRVDLHVREIEFPVDLEECGHKRRKILDAHIGHPTKQIGFLNRLSCERIVNADMEASGLGIDVPDINTPLAVKQDFFPVAITLDANIVFIGL